MKTYFNTLQSEMDPEHFSRLVFALIGGPYGMTTGFKYSPEKAQELHDHVQTLWDQYAETHDAVDADLTIAHVPNYLEALQAAIDAGPEAGSDKIKLGPHWRELEKLLLSAAAVSRSEKPLPPKIMAAFLCHDHGKGEGVIKELLHQIQIQDLSALRITEDHPLYNQLDAIKAGIEGKDFLAGFAVLKSHLEHDQINEAALAISDALPEGHLFKFMKTTSAAVVEVALGRAGQAQMAKPEMDHTLKVLKTCMQAATAESSTSEEEAALLKNFALHFFPKSEGNTALIDQAAEGGQLDFLVLTMIDILGQANFGRDDGVKRGDPFAIALHEVVTSSFEVFHYLLGAINLSKGGEITSNHFDQAVLNYLKLDDSGIQPKNNAAIVVALLLTRMPTTEPSKANIPNFVEALNSIFTTHPELTACFNRDLDSGGMAVGYLPEAIAYTVALYQGTSLMGENNSNDIMAHADFSTVLCDPTALETVLLSVNEFVNTKKAELGAAYTPESVIELEHVNRENVDTQAIIAKHRAQVVEKAAVTIQRHVRGHLARKTEQTEQIAALAPEGEQHEEGEAMQAVELVAKEAPQIPAPAPGVEQAAAGGGGAKPTSPQPSGDDQ